MHAAASYGHLELLEYLISKGGDINVTDEDGDTPLYTVESVQVAKWMVEHGAEADVRNAEGLSVSCFLNERLLRGTETKHSSSLIQPAEALFEDHPEPAVYLQSLLVGNGSASVPLAVTSSTTATTADPTRPSEFQAEQLSTRISETLMEETNEIMQRAEREGRDPEDELREAVSRAVLQGWGGINRAETGDDGQAGDEAPDSKRSRAE